VDMGVDQGVGVASADKNLVDVQDFIIFLRMTIYACSHKTIVLMVSMGKQFYSATLKFT
jgi:hypothetical protein